MPRWLQAEVGVLYVFWLAFKQLSYKLCGVHNASTGILHYLHDGPFHHWLMGDMGVLVPEACQHIHYRCFHQGVALCLQLSTDDLLQL
jgi:hypothetical protein